MKVLMKGLVMGVDRRRSGICVGAILALASISGQAFAGVNCQGVVTNVLLEAGGQVEVVYGFGLNRLCNLDATESRNTGAGAYGIISVTPQACQAIYSGLLTAKSSGKMIAVHFDTTTCPTTQLLPTFPYAIEFPQ